MLRYNKSIEEIINDHKRYSSQISKISKEIREIDEPELENINYKFHILGEVKTMNLKEIREGLDLFML